MEDRKLNLKKAEQTIDVIIGSRSDFVAERENLGEVLKYVEKFSGAEAVVAMTIYQMTINTLAKMCTDEVKKKPAKSAKGK